jgi:transposase
LDPRQLRFLDEAGAHTRMTRLYGRAPRGQRVVDRVPQGHYQTTTMLATLGLNGVTAPSVLSGSITGASFLTYLKESLVPTLRKGNVVILDNLPVHKVAGVNEAVGAVGARVLPLPPYSPDYNPIERMWSQVKARLKQAKARTKATLRRAIRQAMNSVRLADCANYLQNAPWATTKRKML